MFGVIILVVYTMLMLDITLLLTRKETTAEGFLVADRNTGAVISAMSISATWIWSPALFTSAERAYLNGWIGLFWFLVPNILCLIVFIPFAKTIRKQMPNGITLSGYMFHVYKSQKVKNIYLFQLIMLAVLSTAVQLLAGGKILSQITNIPFWLITIILGLIAYSYSQFSGIKASIITDALQMILMLLVSVCTVLYFLKPLNNSIELGINLFGYTNEYTGLTSPKGIEVFFAFGLPTAIGLIAGPFSDQCFWQRAFSIKRNQITKAFLLGAGMFTVVPLSMGILGFIAAGSSIEIKDTSIVNFELIRNALPSGMVVAFLFMLISGLLSTVDSNLCAVASLTTDIKKEINIKYSKRAMILLLIAGISIANIPKISVTHLFLIYGTLRATTLLPTVMTLKKFKLSSKGVFFGVLISLIIGLPIFSYGTILNLSLYKTIGSLLTVLLSGIIAIIISKVGYRKG